MMTSLFAALVLPALAPPPPITSEIETFLAHPARVFAREHVPGGFRIIALSHLAEGCAGLARTDPSQREAARACVDRVAAFAPTLGAGKAGEGNLFGTHLLIVRASRAALHPEAALDDDTRRLAAGLAASILEDPRHTPPSYVGTKGRWPADQAATLHALALTDAVWGTHFHEAPTAAWLAWMQAHGTDAATGLPVSEVSGAFPTSRVPRGCALSWTVRYLSFVAPKEAKGIWDRTVAQLRLDVGPATGVREWPSNMAFPEDLDSGPIVLGVGAAATAFGVGAARAVGDTAMFEALARSQALAESLLGLLGADVAKHADTILARSITFAMRRAAPGGRVEASR